MSDYTPPSPAATLWYFTLLLVCGLGIAASVIDIAENGIFSNANYLGWFIIGRWAHRRITQTPTKTGVRT